MELKWINFRIAVRLFLEELSSVNSLKEIVFRRRYINKIADEMMKRNKDIVDRLLSFDWSSEIHYAIALELKLWNRIEDYLKRQGYCRLWNIKVEEALFKKIEQLKEERA